MALKESFKELNTMSCEVWMATRKLLPEIEAEASAGGTDGLEPPCVRTLLNQAADALVTSEGEVVRLPDEVKACVCHFAAEAYVLGALSVLEAQRRTVEDPDPPIASLITAGVELEKVSSLC